MPFRSNVRTTLAGALLLTGAQAFIGPEAGREIPAWLPAWLAPAQAQAQTAQVANIRIGGDGASIDIPQATIEGANLPAATLQSLFDARADGPLAGRPVAERLAGLSATRITIPELTITLSGEALTQVTRYVDVELRDIVDGVIGRASAQRTSRTETVTLKKDDGTSGTVEVFAGTSGEASLEGLDTAFTARLIEGGGADAGERPTRRIHGRFAMNDYRFTQRLPLDQSADPDLLIVEGTVESAAGEGALGRQTRMPFSEFIAVLEAAQEEFGELPADKQRVLLAGVSDFLSSFDFEPSTATNIAIRTKGLGEDADFTLTLRSVSGRYLDQRLHFAIDGLAFSGAPRAGAAQPNTFSVERIAIDDLSFVSTIAALDEAVAAAAKEGGKPAVDGARLAPTGGRLSLADVGVDIDVSSGGTAAAERLAFSIKAFETTTGGHVTDGRAGFETVLTDLHLTLPEKTDTDGLRELRALGYSELTLSSALRGHWEEATGRLTVDTLSLSGIDVGGVAIGALLGGIGKDAYSGDLGLTLAALQKSSLHELQVTLEDGGLFERFVRQQSGQGAGSADEIRQQYGALATIGIPALLGDTPTTRKLAAAVSRFATKPGKLTVNAKARDPQGVPVNTLDAGAAPAELLERFDVTASN